MKKMNVGILGAGRIAGIMADTLQKMDTIRAQWGMKYPWEKENW